MNKICPECRGLRFITRYEVGVYSTSAWNAPCTNCVDGTIEVDEVEHGND